MTQPWPIHLAHLIKAPPDGRLLPVSGASGHEPPRLAPRNLLISLGMLCLALVSAPFAEAISLSPEWAMTHPPAAPKRLLFVQAKADGFKALDVTGPAGRPIPLKIVLPDAGSALQDQFLIFKGIPDGIELTPGGDLGEFWAVNADLFDKVTLKAPEGFSGSFAVKVEHAGNIAGTPHQTVTFTATITDPKIAEAPVEQTVAEATLDQDAPESTLSPPETAGVQAVVQTPADAIGPAVATPLRKEPEEHASIETPSDRAAPPVTVSSPPAPSPDPAHKKLMDRAISLFGRGDISGARAVFEYLAARGNADAAIALGGTYDPAVLSTVAIKGLDPNPEKAQYWYEKADELGSAKARSRLDALARR